MSITGSLADISFSEILQFVETGRRTGLLTLSKLPTSQTVPSIFYIWVERGRLVAAAQALDHLGLVKLIKQRQWISERVFDKLMHWCCPLEQPLGLYLKNQGVLRPEQLKQLFNVQVLQPANALFYLKEGHLQFDQNASTPKREMTGLSVSAGALKLFTLPEDAKALRPDYGKGTNEHSSVRYQENFNTELLG